MTGAGYGVRPPITRLQQHPIEDQVRLDAHNNYRCKPSSPAPTTGSFSLLNACMATCLRHYTDGIGIESLQWDPKKITQHAFAKLTLIKLKAPERHTVVAASYPDRQQALVGEE